MALILSIETATTVCSVALHKEGKLLANESLYIAQSHSGLLIPVIENLVKTIGYSIMDVEAIAISKGPGSYTGLRIGAATAKGLCHAIDRPLISVNSLDGMTAGVAKFLPESSLLCPMIDARRMEVFCKIMDNDLNTIEKTKPEIVTVDSFQRFLNKDEVYFFGNGSAKCKDVVLHENARFIDDIELDATHLGVLAFQKYKKQDFEDVAYFDPFYLKEFRVTKPKAK